MIFKQLFDKNSSTYTYIISSGQGREALIIDPVIESTSEYLQVLQELDLKLVKVIDTHIHADHITGLNELSKQTNCLKIMGEKSSSEVIDIRVKDNEKIIIADSINKKNTYDNISDKFELSNFEKIIIKNLTESISNDFA